LKPSSGPTYERLLFKFGYWWLQTATSKRKERQSVCPEEKRIVEKPDIYIEILLATCYFSACATLATIWCLKASPLSTDSLPYNYSSPNLLRYSILRALAIL
jgi:hypothetical protein